MHAQNHQFHFVAQVDDELSANLSWCKGVIPLEKFSIYNEFKNV